MSNKHKPDEALLTRSYFTSVNTNYFYRAFKQLALASHWVCPDTGEEIKLSHNLKAVYFHKLDQYIAFTQRGQLYHESHQTVADKLGLGLKTVEERVIPLLKQMGLISIQKISQRRYITTMYPLNEINGWLINRKLSKHISTENENRPWDSKKSKSITHDQFKNTVKNKKNLEKIKKGMTEDLVVLTKEEFERLLKRKGE